MHIFAKTRLYQALFSFSSLIPGTLLPATDERVSKNVEKLLCVKAVAGAGVLGFSVYSLADYYNKLPVWVPSLRLGLTEVKKHCIEHQDRALACLGGLCALSCGIGSVIVYRRSIDELEEMQKALGLISIEEQKDVRGQLEERAASRPYQSSGILSMHQLADFSDAEKEQATSFLARYSQQVQIREQLPPAPESITSRCWQYLRPFPLHLETIAQQAIRDVGILEPVFFYETDGVCQSIDHPFNRVGFDSQTISVPESALLDGKNFHGVNFFRTLYHELCHIKGKHTKKDVLSERTARYEELSRHQTIVVRQTDRFGGGIREAICPQGDHSGCELCRKIELLPKMPEGAERLYRRYKEMEAELGAAYYLRRLKGISIESSRGTYPHDDGIHPTGEDQQRYNEYLLAMMDACPDLEYSAVQELAKQYLIEKNPYFALLFGAETGCLSVAASSSPSSSS